MWIDSIKKGFFKLIKTIINKDIQEKDAMANPSMFASRKFVLTLLIFIAGTLMCVVPPVISSFVYKSLTPLSVLSGSEWVTVMSMICGFYFGANVVQKHVLKNSSDDNGNENDDALAVRPPPEKVKLPENKDIPKS